MKNEKSSKRRTPTIAPGMHTQAELDQDASSKDSKKGNVTQVTRVEVDPT